MIQLQIYMGETATVMVSGEDEKQVIEQAAFFSAMPRVCPICQSSVVFTHRRPKGFTFYGLRCLGSPAHETDFGQHKEGGKLFYRENEPWKQFGAVTEERQDNGQPESTNLDRSITQACEILGKTEDQLNDWVSKKYGAKSGWQKLPVVHKQEVHKFLQMKVDELEPAF